MPRYFCTGCRAETDTDFMRRDDADYWWCHQCKPVLLGAENPQRPVENPTAPATPEAATARRTAKTDDVKRVTSRRLTKRREAR